METEQQAEQVRVEKPRTGREVKWHEHTRFAAFSFLIIGLLFLQSGLWFGGAAGVIISYPLFRVSRSLKKRFSESRETDRKNIWQ